MSDPFGARMARVRAAMAHHRIDALLLSVGADLPWLTGYEAMPLERLTMLVVPRDADATLVVPVLEIPRVTERPDLFSIVGWGETEDPVDVVASLVGRAARMAIGDRTWARFVLAIQRRLPVAAFVEGSAVVGPLRAIKDDYELAALRLASAAADRVAVQLQRGDIPLIGRTEAQVSDDIGRRLIAEGHRRVNFSIVATGANAASPHHAAGPRVIAPDEIVLCDFGGTYPTDHGVGYCSDITRCVFTGAPSPALAELYAVLAAAQASAVAGAAVGTTCEALDAIARDLIASSGYGELFIHRTGHGIGVEEHEDPYIVAGNATPLASGHAFSIEPGIYVPGRWGARLEDIVVASTAGPEPLNHADHALVPVQA